LLECHSGLGHRKHLKRTPTGDLNALTARLHQRIAGRRKGQLVDDDQLQGVAWDIKTFPE
jgi:hypothetical protein